VQLAKSWLQRMAVAKIKVASAVLLTLLLLVLTDRLAHKARGDTLSESHTPPALQNPTPPPVEYKSPSVTEPSLPNLVLEDESDDPFSSDAH
jgi:hypothetical protein